MSKLAPTVFVVDDDASFLRSIGRWLHSHGYIVKSYGSAADFLARRPKQATGCVVVDLQMPGMDGISFQKVLGHSDHPLPVVFLTGHGDIQTSVAAMKGGAEDFLVKTASKDALLDAIERALARDASEREVRLRQRAMSMRFAELTPREQEVLSHVLKGRLNKQIAIDLGIDERSVKRHRTNMMSKIGVKSVAELAQLAVVVGISEELRVPGDRLPLPTKHS
jgi:FixJ family two-component response regulator